jgi:hypothetical protein
VSSRRRTARRDPCFNVVNNNGTHPGGTAMSGKKIEPKVPTTSVNKADKTKTEEERTSQRINQRVYQRVNQRVQI